MEEGGAGAGVGGWVGGCSEQAVISKQARDIVVCCMSVRPPPPPLFPPHSTTKHGVPLRTRAGGAIDTFVGSLRVFGAALASASGTALHPRVIFGAGY